MLRRPGQFIYPPIAKGEIEFLLFTHTLFSLINPFFRLFHVFFRSFHLERMKHPNVLLQFKEIASVSFFFFIIFCFSSVELALAADPRPEDCEPKDCGNGLKISYPFWIGGQQPSYCGFPAFELTCKSRTPVLKISNEDYYVNNIFYENKSMVLAKAEFQGSACPYPKHNLTLDLSPFEPSFPNEKLHFFLNCTESIGQGTYLSKIPCASSNDRFSFVGDSQLADQAVTSQKCQSFVVIPFTPSYPGESSSNYQIILKRGLLVNWTAADCGDCEGSGGRCGYGDTDGKFMCFCNDRPHDVTCKGSNSKLKIALGVSAGILGIIVVCGVFYFCYQRKKKAKSASTTSLSRSSSFDPSFKKDPELGNTHYQTNIFTYKELLEATDGFADSKELGDGGFGTVYHGKLKDGRIVAVKRLYENNYKRVEQFMNEVEILNRLRHKNLVTLYGCTSRHSRELLLVYEYVANGTVADHLHGHRASEGVLTWPLRMSIAIETAEALTYLHAVEPQIIHRDIKTNNILLDNNFGVKVADFGLSRLFPVDATHVSTAPQGTPGYLDPEYHQCYQLTDKSDVYSFGVVLVELISSKPAVDITRHRYEINLSNMAVNKIQNGLLHELVDPGIGFETDSGVRRMVTLVSELAFRCLQGEKEMRPSMEEVLDVLRGIEDGVYKAEKKEADGTVKDDASLLKNGLPFSPDSVTNKWASKSTTPNSSE